MPTVIAIGIYFCFSDSVILLQSFYYKLRNRSAASASTSTLKDEEQALTGTALEPPLPTEDDPLLSQRPPSSYSGRRPSQPSGTLAEKRSSSSNALSRDLLSVALVCAAGACGWAIAWQAGAWRPTSEAPDEEGGASMVLGAQALGYFSAVCYLGARVPQIRKNYRERSCEGLSRLFFMLSILGNVTYGAGVSCALRERGDERG